MQTNDPPLTQGLTEPGLGSSAPGAAPRLLALSALVGTAGALGWLVLAIVQVFTDAWIALIALSPDSDTVLQLNLDLTRQRAEIGRAEAEVARFEAEIAAIDGGLERLRTLRDRGNEMFEYGAGLREAEASSLSEQIT